MVGGGDTAAEEAIYLTKYGKHVSSRHAAPDQQEAETLCLPLLPVRCACADVGRFKTCVEVVIPAVKPADPPFEPVFLHGSSQAELHSSCPCCVSGWAQQRQIAVRCSIGSQRTGLHYALTPGLPLHSARHSQG